MNAFKNTKVIRTFVSSCALYITFPLKTCYNTASYTGIIISKSKLSCVHLDMQDYTVVYCCKDFISMHKHVSNHGCSFQFLKYSATALLNTSNSLGVDNLPIIYVY